MFYLLNCDCENFRNYYLSKNLSANEAVELSKSFDGRSHGDSYTAITFFMTRKKESEYPIADWQTGCIPICSKKMKDVVEEMCSENEVEFLPCKLEGTDEVYYIMNILGLEDCVDYEKSKFTRFPSNPNKIMFFEYIEFKNKVNRHFFRIKDLPYCHYFVSQEAKEKLENAGLKGLVFDNKLFI